MGYYSLDVREIYARIAKRHRRRALHQGTLMFEEKTNIREIENEHGERLICVSGTIPTDLHVENGQRFLFISFDQSKFSHGIHKYPAKFFPELPRWFVHRYSKEGDWVLDPFMGSGTTNVECLLSGRHSVGIDVDPFARLVAKVKTTPLNASELKTANEVLLEQVICYEPTLVRDDEIPQFPYRDMWFKPEILRELTYIKRLIETMTVSENLRDFYKVCLSSIIRTVSNADDSFTKPTISSKVKKEVYPSLALRKFIETLLIYTPRVMTVAEHALQARVEIPVGSDARRILYGDKSFDLAVTSPPYSNALDYSRTHQLELYWLGFVEGSINELKRVQIGTEAVYSKDYKTLYQIGIEPADDIIKRIYAVDPKRAYICYRYLMDMAQNFREVYRTLKEGGRYVIVVGNNSIRGHVFESWRYLMLLAEQVGYTVESYFGSEIIRHALKVQKESRIKTDWVIVLRK